MVNTRGDHRRNHNFAATVLKTEGQNMYFKHSWYVNWNYIGTPIHKHCDSVVKPITVRVLGV